MEQEKEPRVKILVCCHKPGKWLSDDVYMPIHCGKAISNVDLGIQGDDTGDNISAKNPYYCELTAIYWAWKNLQDIDYIGLCHYRRYFAFGYKGVREMLTVGDLENASCLQMDESVLSKCDIVLAKPYTLPYNMYTWYSVCHHSDDIKILRKIIYDRYPDYIESFEKVMCGNVFSAYNMFLMKKSVYDGYCEWLFGLLDAFNKKLKIENYNDYQKRVIAFAAERLLPVYFYSNKYVKQNRAIYFIKDQGAINPTKGSAVKCVVRRCIDNASYLFNRNRHLGGFYNYE